MKICIVSNSHPTNDVRLYYKLAMSLAKQNEVYLITTNGIVNNTHNPYQIVVDASSRRLAIWLLGKKVKELKPEIIICVEPLTLLIAWILKKKLKFKVVFDVHEFFALSFSERFPRVLRFPAYLFYQLFLKQLMKIADAVFTVNQEICNQLLGRNKRKPYLVLPNYPVKNVWDYECNIPGSLEQLCQMKFDFIYIGGLTEDRGIFKILKVVSLLKHDFPFLKVLILGKFFKTETEKRFNQSINDYNLNAIIYYQSWIPAEKIGLLLKRCRFGLWFFNPKNRRLRLSTPLKVLEYLSAGLPVITIKTPLMKALIEKNGVGICSAYQSNALADACAKMLKLSDDEYNAMSKKCLELSENKYNWETMEPELFKVINGLSKK
ncbi:MAG: glycosyltransferase [Candidatus Cloacimonas acidaminovorans]|jgi:glycosyltransferase involved in cell wall biosynthesis